MAGGGLQPLYPIHFHIDFIRKSIGYQDIRSHDTRLMSDLVRSQTSDDGDQQPRPWIRIGILHKRTKSLIRFVANRYVWQPRLFVLLPSCIQYYKRNEPRARGVLNLQAIEDASQIEADDNVSNEVVESPCFQIKYGDKTFYLRADCPEEAAGWVRDIVNSKYAPSGPTLAVINDSDHDKPWRIRSNPDLGPPINIAADSISQSCQSGDILLFRTAGVRGGIVRNAIQSAYDHVGMILKLKNGQIAVLEALGNTGVHAVEFKSFVTEAWHEQYSQICIRHLESPVSPASSRALAAFCRRVAGRGYSWKPSVHVLRCHRPDDTQTEKYFCSELLASAFKGMGYLRPDLPASRYTPAMFSYSYNLQLLENRLSPEINILFS